MTETAMMSKTQRNIVNCISGFIAEHGFSPTIREIQLLLGYKSSSSVHFQVHKLADAGIISYEPSKPRTMVFVSGDLNRVRHKSDKVPTDVR